MRAINIECPSCHAPAEQGCVDIGVGDDPRTSTGYHYSRVRRAQNITTAERSDRAAKRAAMRSKRP